VVNRLVQHLRPQRFGGSFDTRENREVEDGIDLIEGQPVLHFAIEALKKSASISFEKVNDFPVAPTTVLPGQREWGFVVANGY